MRGVGQSATERLYAGESGRSYHLGKRRLPDAALPWLIEDRASKFEQYIGPNDRVVEFGAGAGWNLGGLSNDVRIAVDVENFVAPELQSSGIDYCASSSELDAASVDVVICHHMLEHVSAPGEVLEEAERLLTPHGRLLLHVPYETQRRFRTYDPAEPNHHLYAWNVQTLAALVAEFGFTIEHAGLGRYGYDRVAGSTAAKLRLGRTGFRWLRSLAHLVRPVREVVVRASPGQRPE